jgi:hypothetical protein
MPRIARIICCCFPWIFLSYGAVVNMKFEPAKIAITIVTIFTLSACIEVEDDSNNELTAALQQQNQILSEQLTQSQQTNTVTISGLVVDALDSSAVSDVTITVKTASGTIFEDQSVEDGLFSVSGLPANSALEIVISSVDDSFMTRVFYRNTGDSTSGVAEKDFGKFDISAGQEVIITVADSETNMPVSGLQFTANSNSGSGASEDSFMHVSTFDEVNGVYIITLPKYLDVAALASIDTDRDGVRDFAVDNYIYVSGTNLIVHTSQLDALIPILVTRIAEVQLDEVQFRLSIVSASASTIETAIVAVNDENNDVTATFDAESGQYLIDARINNYVELQIPAFTADNINYESASITIYDNSDSNYSVSISNSANSTFYQITKDEIIELVLQPRILTQSNTPLEVILVNEPALSENNSLSIFYSQAVTVPAASTSLNNLDAITVTKGNESDTDVVLPGTTSIIGGEVVEITAAMSLNDTKLKLAPTTALKSNTRYEYNVGNVTIKSDEIDVDLNRDDNISFTTANPVSDDTFDISDLKLDNKNFTTNGTAIVAQNTAGIDANTSNNRGSVTLFLPKEMNQLKTLTLNQTSYMQNGFNNVQFRAFQVILNSQSNSVSKIFAISTAQNENVEQTNLSRSLLLGTTLADGEQFFYNNSLEFLSDNLSGTANSISFDYAYETKAGEVTTGSITLPIL